MVFLQNVDECYARPLCTQVITISIHSLTMLGHGIVWQAALEERYRGILPTEMCLFSREQVSLFRVLIASNFSCRFFLVPWQECTLELSLVKLLSSGVNLEIFQERNMPKPCYNTIFGVCARKSYKQQDHARTRPFWYI